MKKPLTKNSPGKEHHQVQVLGMISAKRAEALLYEWVNLPDSRMDTMPARYPEIFIFKTKKETYRVLDTVRAGLRKIWDVRDTRQRDWDICTLRGSYQKSRTREDHGLSDLFSDTTDNDFFPGLPRLTPFEAAMFYLQTGLVHRMLRCRNPECAAPYFFRTEKGQESCSPECADWSRKNYKLRWYQDSPKSSKNRSKAT